MSRYPTSNNALWQTDNIGKSQNMGNITESQALCLIYCAANWQVFWLAAPNQMQKRSKVLSRTNPAGFGTTFGIVGIVVLTIMLSLLITQ